MHIDIIGKLEARVAAAAETSLIIYTVSMMSTQCWISLAFIDVNAVTIQYLLKFEEGEFLE